MRLNTIKPSDGSKKEVRRVGRGIGSGFGKTAGRGHKGQKSRARVFIKSALKAGKCLFKEDFQKEVLDLCLNLTTQK